MSRINSTKGRHKTNISIASNSNIPEELGRISYIFSDKTGTLTKNEMIFKKMEIINKDFNEDFGENNFDELKDILNKECELFDAPFLDIYNINNDSSINNSSSEINFEDKDIITLNKKKKKNNIRRKRDKIIRDSITAMLLCNNVTPIKDENDENNITYQASSPDEIALVKFASSLRMKLIYRTDKIIKIENANNIIEEYEILANFPFSSETKRMGIIVRNKKYGHIIFYLKGAENVIKKYTKEEYIGFIDESTEDLAIKGLRTLVLTEKIISEEDFNKWNIEYQEASNSMINRKENITKIISKLENDMEYLCVTGVEDQLQNDVVNTIENLRSAGIKIWMLTGDKVETAKCISISTGIKKRYIYLKKNKKKNT